MTLDPVEYELSLPSTDPARYDWQALADKAMEHPGKWLRIDTEGTPATATRVNRRQVAALRDIKGWRFRARSTEVTRGPNRRCYLWLRATESTP
jgi:hypothetical protein